MCVREVVRVRWEGQRDWSDGVTEQLNNLNARERAPAVENAAVVVVVVVVVAAAGAIRV